VTAAEEHEETGNKVPAPSPTAHLIQRYREVKDGTTPPDQILVLLLEGAVRFVEQAAESLACRDLEAKNTRLCKAQRIVLELTGALDPSIGEQTFRNLRGLYFFVYRRLVEANVHNDERALQEGLKVLRDLFELWREAVRGYREGLARSRDGGRPRTSETEGLCVQC
jgi:flagellar protein FliS